MAGAVRADEVKGSPEFFTSLDLGIGSIDEDLFFMTSVEQGFAYGGLRLVLSGPFHFRLHDNSPMDDGVLRRQDWDEPSDFSRILRTLEYDRTFDDGHVRLFFGELNGVSLGHGSVVSQYYNSTDMDHYQGGLKLAGDFRGNGVELFTEDVVAPSVFVARIYAAPLSFFLDGKWARRFEVGITGALDTGVGHRVLSDGKTWVGVLGGDLSLLFVDVSRMTMTVYLDLLGMDGDAGLHAGLGASFVLSSSRNWVLHLASEYRYMGSDYIPALINPFYDVNRRFFTVDPASGDRNTLAEHLANPLVAFDASHGFMGDIALDLNGRVRAGGRYDFQGPDRPAWLVFRLEIVPVERFSLHLFYGGQDLAGGAAVFSGDALMGASLHTKIVGPLRGFAGFSRRYRRVGNEMPAFANEISGGVGIIFAY